MTLPMTLTAPCQRNGCADKATVVPKLFIPVRGHRHAAPWECLIALEVCRTHLAALVPYDYLTRLVRGGAKRQMRAAGCEPDFERAFFGSVHIMSPEYRQFQAAQRGEGAQQAGLVLWDGLP